MINCYKVLGVEKGANDDDIKKAYRKLAMLHHPDRNKGSKESEDKFKEVNEAYTTLSSPQKREMYDRGSGTFTSNSGQTSPFGGFPFRTGNLNPEDILSGFFWDLQEAKRRQGTTYHITMTMDFQHAFWGCSKQITIKGNQLEILVPPGVVSGQTLLLRGQGGPPGVKDGIKGDVIATFIVKEHPIYTREGFDIYVNKNIKLTDAILGCNLLVTTLDGDKNIKVPVGVGHLTKVRLSGLGVPKGDLNNRGDFYVRIGIVIPRNLDREQRKVIERLKEVGL